MKLYYVKSSSDIKLGATVQFVEPVPSQGIEVGRYGQLCDTRGKYAWVWVPPVNGYKAPAIRVELSKIKAVPGPDKDPLAPFIGLSGKFIDAQKDVVSKYDIDVAPDSHCWSRMHAHVKERRVCKFHPKNSAQSTFDLFHEIGHIETTKSGMRRCEEEYYATVWAIQKMQEYGLPIPIKTIEDYQKYINWELEKGLRRGGSGYDKDLDLYKYL
jgi:hypothetical protein